MITDYELRQRFEEIMGDDSLVTVHKMDKLHELYAEITAQREELAAMQFDDCAGGACKL